MKALRDSIEEVNKLLDKSGQPCPICNKEAKEVKSKVLCSRYGKLICMKHCFEGCNYMEENTSRCTYRFKRNEEKRA
ncbi:hypothetical protein SDC9_142927 [bioreactor metagenome]|uniref:Uncharacterized protein n=1 Tax=bioreactor metagenome TaxID=1076179 RepID=A0A645E5C1_9ZZZZ